MPTSSACLPPGCSPCAFGSKCNRGCGRLPGLFRFTRRNLDQTCATGARCLSSAFSPRQWKQLATTVFSKHGVFSSQQYGFRKELGTSDTLMKLLNDWSSTAASGGMVHALAIDIAEAFDKVSHRGVLHKTEACGIRDPWLALKLPLLPATTCCSRRTTVSGIPCAFWGPQGSILGPTLFLVYINDCEEVIPDSTSLGVYADDTTVYKCIAATCDILASATQLQLAVDSIARWGAEWKMASNRPSPRHSQLTFTVRQHLFPTYCSTVPGCLKRARSSSTGFCSTQHCDSRPTYARLPPGPTNASTSCGRWRHF